MLQVVINMGLLVLVGVAAVSHFGWLSGLGVLGAIYLLMPFGMIRQSL